MHPLVAHALTLAGERVDCEAAREPVMEGLRRALLDSGVPAPADMARLGELLQLSLLITQRAQDAVVRGLRWCEQAHATVGRRPRGRLTASLDAGLNVLLLSEDHEPLVWEFQGRPLNTLLYLRADELVTNTAEHHAEEHWVVGQARFQACGVLSGTLLHLVQALRSVADIELEDWPAYRREDKGLRLELSARALRAGLWLRSESARRQSLLAGTEATLNASLERVGLSDWEGWLALAQRARGNATALRDLVRGVGLPHTTATQVKAVVSAAERWQQATQEAQEAQVAARELRAHWAKRGTTGTS